MSAFSDSTPPGVTPLLSPAKILSTAVSWLLFLAAFAGSAYLYHTRVPLPAPVSSEAAPAPPPPWRRELDAITAMEGDPLVVCGRLRDLLPSLPPEAQVEAITHLVTFLPDASYAMVQEITSRFELPAAAWQVITSDALNRPNPVKLPVLLEILRRAEDPPRQQAKDELTSQLGSDYKEDWDAWREALARAAPATAP